MPTSSPAPAGESSLVLPELLAPAGDWDCVRAAVENGADAVYFGLDRFNARMRAQNFTEADLPRLMEFLHRRGVRGYVTFNTLVFTDELPAARTYLRSLIAAGVDAAIVQDVGICRLIRQLSPDFPIHGSTQMTITSVAGVELARDLGCELVVLARENSLTEIQAIQTAQQTTQAAHPEQLPLPLEVFVHGALCVAYSGQCLTSESLGGRSANRGECAQACRMPYELVSDGQTVPLGDRRYLLSPQDLAGLEVLPDLVRSGVRSLKIEGRLKSPEYVASITRVYRRALDKLRAETTAGTAPAAGTAHVLPSDRYELEMAFSRGLYPGWFRGVQNQELAHARFGKKRGVLLGIVTRVERERVVIRPESALKLGDGVGFDAGRPDLPEEGGRIYEIRPVGSAGELALAFGHGSVNFDAIHVGDRLWKTHDPELERDLHRTYAGDQPKFQRPIDWEVHGHAGSPLTLIARDGQGHVAQVTSSIVLALAEKSPLTTSRLSEQLGRLGGSPFRLGSMDNRLEGDVILPVSELNRLRRDVVALLDAQRIAPQRWQLRPEVEVPLPRAVGGSAAGAADAADAAEEPELIVLVRTPAQLDAALLAGARTLYCDFEDPKKYREAVRTARTSFGCAGPDRTIWVAPPRIFKPGEEWILQQVKSADPDGYLVRNAEHLRYFRGARLRGDFSFNVANPLTAEYYIQTHGLERITASYDLNVTQLEGLLQGTPPAWLELTIHQHMPMFHMEHCVFCAFLSSGKDFRDCGRPCDKHEVRLRDRVGTEHPLKADAGCRNTVFNARAQTGAESLDRFRALGARHFRLEFVNESPETVTATIARYRALLRGEITGTQLWQEMKLQNQLGVTRGQMEKNEARQVFPARNA